MVERMQEQEGDNRIVAKSKRTTMNLAFSVSTRSPSVHSPIASKSPGVLKASSRQLGCSGKPDAKRKWYSNPDAASSSMAKGCSTGCQFRETCRDRWRPGIPELSGDWLYRETCRTRIPRISWKPRTPGNSEDSKTEGAIWPHHYHMSPDCVPDMNKVFSIVRQTYGRSPTDDLNDVVVNTVCGFFMSVTLQAAVHLGQNDTENLRSTKNQRLKSVRQLLWTTERLITDQAEITGLTTIDWKQPTWKETILFLWESCSDCKTYVFSHSVLCPGGISDEPVKAWESMIECFGNTLSQRFGSDRRRADGIRVENFSEQRGCSRTNESASRFHWSEAQMQKTVWRTQSENWRRKQTDPSCAANQTATRPTLRGPRWEHLHSWSSIRMEILPFNQTNNFVFIRALGAAQ